MGEYLFGYHKWCLDMREARIHVVLLFFQYPVEYPVSRGLFDGHEASLMGLSHVFISAVHDP